ncbi:CAP domain-containing protein [Dioszegia hungarica]|uniref:CAP domain-containing protein n=1 Tax=Dioszegia hungarica TaxID=4972 RepID=A0AA38H322_9TREE|nr:CAP domain-containing protein [Dioszegia hungarica]KAI9633050.1 CAP domain-containing protein [Dioszegia hungarica]
MLFTTVLPFLAVFAIPAFCAPASADQVVPSAKACPGKAYRTVIRNAPSSTSTSVAASASPVPSLQTSNLAATGGAPAGDATTLLNLHNSFRAQYGAKALTWSSELATYATNYAGGCKFAHSKGPYGENLAAGYGGGYSVTSAFNSWANEAAKYDWNAPGFSSATGHFTQVVWKATTEVGCGVVSCADGTIFSGTQGQKTSYVICEYRKPGNVVGNNNQYFTDNVGTKQS